MDLSLPNLADETGAPTVPNTGLVDHNRWEDTKQLLILKFLTAHLEGINNIAVQSRDENDQPEVISEPDGTLTPKLKRTGLLGRVYRGRTIFGAEEHEPFLSILEGTRPDQAPDPVGYAQTERNEIWPLLIQGFEEDDPNNPLDNLYRLKGAVEQRLSRLVAINGMTGDPKYPDEYLMGGLIIEMSIGPGIVHPINPTQGGVEAFYLPVVIKFDMNVADPYSV